METSGPARRARSTGLALAAAGVAVVAVGLAAGPAAAATTAKVQAGTLRIVGDAGDNRITLRLAPGSPTTLQVDVGDDGTADFSFDRSTFTAVDVQGGAGEDTLRVDQVNGLFTDEAVTLEGGPGNDTLIGGDGADTLGGGGGGDSVDGNRGNDVAQLGGGDDRFQWDPGDGSDVVEGQGGRDDLAFNGSNANEHVDIAANGARVRFARDVASVVMDLDGIDTIDFRALGGTDTVTVGDLAGTATESVNVDLSGFGGGGDGAADTVTATGTAGPDHAVFSSPDGNPTVSGLGAQTHVTGGEPADSLVASMLGGDDSADMAVGVASPLSLHVDGGTGADTAAYKGTPGDDQIGIARNGAEAAVFAPATGLFEIAAVESLAVSGRDGDDTITGQNGLAGLTALTIDGGPGNDRLAGGDGDDLLLGGGGDDFLDGNRGNDTAQLGGGDDSFQWDPGDGSDVIEGQGGQDRLAFNGSNANEQIEVSANGSRTRLTRDVGAISMDFDGVEQVDVAALGGTDAVTVDDLAGTAADLVDVNLNGFDGNGDGAADTVVAQGTDGADDVSFTSPDGRPVVNGIGAQTRVTGGEPGVDNLVVDALGGDDTATMAVGVTSAIQLHFVGGEGTDTARYDGSGGPDQIGIARNGAEVATFAPNGAVLNTAAESLLVSGLDGDDTIAGQNGLAGLTALTVDGGPGNDTLAGGDGDDLLLGGSGDDFLDGNRGNDTAQLGGGDDRFQWDPGDGSDVIEGQGGQDTLAFNGSNANEQIEVSANGSRARLTRDVGAITMDMNSIGTIAVRALGGTDTVTVDDLRGTGAHAVAVDLSGFDGNGDGAADTVVVGGTDRRDVVQVATAGSQVAVTGLAAETDVTGSEPALDTLRVETGGGNDDVTVAPDVAGLIVPVVDLGPDE